MLSIMKIMITRALESTFYFFKTRSVGSPTIQVRKMTIVMAMVIVHNVVDC